MGRMLGSHDGEELDRPDLNKCPECDCFFADDVCPICGKVCPEEMRAGNRAPVKKKKRRKHEDTRVQFIPWYYTWWFILIMTCLFPIGGIVLLMMSPHRRWVKTLFVTLMVIYVILSTVGIPLIFGGIALFQGLFPSPEPVDRTMSQAEYIAACEEVSAEDYYRGTNAYLEKFVTLDLTVTERIVDSEGYYGNEKYTTYYLCTDESGTFTFLIRDCVAGEGHKNFVRGDMITVFGEGAGEVSLVDMNGHPHSAPCVYAAFLSLVG